MNIQHFVRYFSEFQAQGHRGEHTDVIPVKASPAIYSQEGPEWGDFFKIYECSEGSYFCVAGKENAS